MKKEHAMKWVKALRSGKFKQGTRGLLQDGEGGYCCLGVLDKIFPKMNLSGNFATALENFNLIGLDNHLGELPCNVSLANLNDGDKIVQSGFMATEIPNERFTFDEIADIIQIEYVEEIYEKTLS